MYDFDPTREAAWDEPPLPPPPPPSLVWPTCMTEIRRFLQDAAANTTSNDEDAPLAETDNESDVAKLRNMAIVYGFALAVVSVVFCWLRQKYPRPFTLRRWVDSLQTPLADDQFGFFSWIWKLNFLTDHDVMDHCGMDSLCFLRILLMGTKISLVGMFNSLWLFPLYATAHPDQVTTDPIVMITIANVGEGSPRLVGTVLAAYMLFGYTMHLMLKEFEWFIEQRHRYLRRARPDNYSIFVRHIPHDYRSNPLLESFFEKSLGDAAKPEARVCYKTPNLAKAVARRDIVVAGLENALAYQEIHQTRLQHSSQLLPGALGGGAQVDSIDAYAAELETLNTDIAGQIEAIAATAAAHTPYTSSGRGSQHGSNSAKEAPPPSATPSQDIEVAVDEVSALNKVQDSDDTQEDDNNIANSRHSSKSNGGGNFLTKGIKGVAGSALTMADGAAGLAKSTLLLNEAVDGEPHADAFVSFATLAYATAALQLVQDSTPFTMLVESAPMPDDVFWSNVGRQHKDLQLGKLFSVAATATLCIFWTIPMSFFAGLSSVADLKEQFGFVEDILDKVPWMEPVVEQLAPLLVVVFNSLLPIILEYLSMFEGPVSSSVVEASLFSKLAAFMIIQTFFVSAISGGLLSSLKAIADDPLGEGMGLLANELPSQSTFFIQIVFVGTVMMVGMEILRVIPLVLALVRRYVGPRLTEKQRQTTFMGLRPLADPAACAHADNFSQLVFYFMVLFVYQVIAPLTSWVLWFVFLFCFTAYRHQFVYIYPSMPDSGGKMWTSFINLMIVCMLVAEVTIIGLLGLKQAASSVPLMLPLLICTFLFKAYIAQQHFRVAEFLPSRAALKTDVKNGPEFSYELVHEAYLQPELRDKQVYPEGNRAIELGMRPAAKKEVVIAQAL